jgi:tetratricopeptide (TPR) repeat protein
VRVRIAVLLAAVLAAALVVGVVYATRQDPTQPRVTCSSKAAIVPGVASKNVAAVRAAMGQGARGAARSLEPLAQQYPKDPVVLFNDGLALYCGGYVSEAATAFTQAKKDGRNTYYEVASDVLLHPQFFQSPDGPSYPPFTEQSSDPLIVQGELAQRQYHQHTAEGLWARAAKLHPNDDVAQVAAAVGRFDMDNLSGSFSHLGPLVLRFPHSQVVRFYLGLLLAWTGQRDQAVKEFRATVALGAHSGLGKKAQAFLDGLVTGGTSSSKR